LTSAHIDRTWRKRRRRRRRSNQTRKVEDVGKNLLPKETYQRGGEKWSERRWLNMRSWRKEDEKGGRIDEEI
jgi:hypothetical protein